MKLHAISIGSHRFALPLDVDRPRLEAQLTDLIRQGGGMLDIPRTGSDQVSVLVSPGLPILFHTLEVPDDDPPADGSSAWTSAYVDDLDLG